ncbi:RNA-binding S4 domain-containing protein [Streptomyces sp. enrichment culture]|uniref:RNA-binding S4 domain-containing protein n=1 Tax=Streptomyces sp. enrichment culture TaxID=1795815 RepID=UPI003F54B7B9
MASEGAEDDRTRGTDGAGDASATQDAPTGPEPTAAPDPKVAAAVAAAEAAGPPAGGSVRIDSWIWSVRLVKTRSLGASACRGGHVRVNGERVKPAHAVRVGDEVRLRHEGRERVVVVKRLIRKRVGAPVAVQCYIDNSPPPPPREAFAPAGVRDRGAGRPTKRDRRELERLRGLGAAGGLGGLPPGPGAFGDADAADPASPFTAPRDHDGPGVAAGRPRERGGRRKGTDRRTRGKR